MGPWSIPCPLSSPVYENIKKQLGKPTEKVYIKRPGAGYVQHNRCHCNLVCDNKLKFPY